MVNNLSGLLRTALDSVQSYVYIKDENSRYLYANRHTLELFGCTAEGLKLAGDANFFPPDVVQTLRKVDLKVLSGESTREEIVVDDGKSDKKVFLEVKTPIYADDNPDIVIGILGISTDITYQKSLENKALNLSKTDPLTGLANRLELDSVLSEEIKRFARYQRPLSIIMFDIDYFKNVNDNYGHLIGDKCLVKLAEVFRKDSRMVDTVGRWGGEEFLVICPDTDLSGATILAEKFRRLIEESFFMEVKDITGSFGVTSFSVDDTCEGLISRADKALYKAKQLGRNRVEALK